MKKYSAVIIGGGNIAGSHAQGYAAIDEIDIVAVADPDRDKPAGDSSALDGTQSLHGGHSETSLARPWSTGWCRATWSAGGSAFGSGRGGLGLPHLPEIIVGVVGDTDARGGLESKDGVGR